MAQAPLAVRRWTRVEYERLVDLGLFDGGSVERLAPPAVVAPPAFPLARTAVGDLLP